MKKLLPALICCALFFFLLLESKSLSAQENAITVTGKIIAPKSLDNSYAYLMLPTGPGKKSRFYQSAIIDNRFKFALTQRHQDTLVGARLFISSLPAMDGKIYVQHSKSYASHYFYLDTASITIVVNQPAKHAMVKGGEFNRQKRKYEIVDSTYAVMLRQKKEGEPFEPMNTYKLLATLAVIEQYPNSPLSVSEIIPYARLLAFESDKHREKIRETLNGLSPELQATDRVKQLHADYEARLFRMEDKTGLLFPHLAVMDKDLKIFSLSNLYGAKEYVLLDFWATWCYPCLQQQPEVERLSRKFKESNIQIIGISVDDNLENWKKHLTKHSFSYPQYRINHSDKKLMNVIGLAHVPTYTLVEKSSGKVVKHDINIKELEKTLEEYRR